MKGHGQVDWLIFSEGEGLMDLSIFCALISAKLSAVLLLMRSCILS